jgi:quercetin dioxygenase-like cupin family protein
MKLLTSFLVISGIAVTFPLTATAQTMDHTVVSAQDIKWSKGPSSLPQGAESAVLYGDPAKEGMFAFRLKFPKGYRIPPHSHPKPEIVTVISGRHCHVNGVYYRLPHLRGDPGSIKSTT